MVMKFLRLSLLAFLLLGLNFASKAQVSCPANIDFELGNTSVWNYYIGSCCSGGGSGSMTGWTSSAAISGRHTLTTGTATDAYGFFPIVAPGGGSYSLKLGSTATGYLAERARYYIHVPTTTSSYSLIYKYAIVLENPTGHGASIQPRFNVSAYDSATGAAIPCAQYNFVSSSSLPGFFLSPITSASAGNACYCKSWTTASINLTGLGGTTVSIDFEAGDCGAGGHFGYGYIDLTCGLFAVTTIGCDSTSATLTAPPGYMSYRWYDSSTFASVIDTVQTTTIAMPGVPTTYAVIIIPYTGYGCPDTLYTHIIPSRLAIHKMSDTTICFGGATSFTLRSGATDVTALTYAWSPASTLSCTSCATPTATPTGTTTYYFTVTNAVGCHYTDSIRVFGTLVAASITSTNVTCYGDTNGTATATPTAGTAPYYYSWSTSPVQHTATATGLAAGTYTLNITDSTGCTGISTVTITQPGPTVINISSYTHPTTCGGTDGTITIGGLVPGSTDTFIYDVTPYGGTATTVTRIVTASGSGVIVLTGLTGSTYPNYTTYSNIRVVTAGCQYNVVGPVQLRDPMPPAKPTAVDPVYCQYDYPSPLAATGAGLLWYSPGSTTGSATAPTPTTTTPGFTYYLVTQTVANCVSPADTAMVTVIPKPSVPVVADTSYCQFSTVPPLTAGGTNLKWYTTSAGGTALTGGAPTPSTTTVGTTTWYVSQTVNGCESDRSAITVTILYLPSFTISQSRSFLCQHDTLTFNYSGPALTAPAYTWSIPTGSTILSGTSTTPSIVVQFDSLYFQTVYLTVSNYGGRCSTTDTLRIHVVPEPTAHAYLKENICLGDTVTIALSDRASNADHFNWDFDGASIITANSNSGGPYKICWHTPGIHVVKLRSVTVEGCMGKEVYDTIKIIGLPDARIFTHSLNGTICLEDSLYLSAVDSNQYGNSFRWEPAHFFHNTNRSGVWGKIETPGYVSLHVTNAFGCSAEDRVLITPDACCKVTFPSAFTPNGDGKNDVFRPLTDGYHRFHSFRITNRWGQTVFESTNSKVEWDGTFGGTPQDMGVYFYFIKFDCGGSTYMDKGDVTLIR